MKTFPDHRPRLSRLARPGVHILLTGLLLGTAPSGWANLELEQHAGIEAQYYLTQDNRYSTAPWIPGSRLGVFYDNELHPSESLVLFFEAGTTTLLSRNENSSFLMDRLHYRLAPGGRVQLGVHEWSTLLAHECVHFIDRKNRGGSIFWNIVQFEVGSLGAYERNIVSRATSRSATAQHALDYRVGLGAFLTGDASRYIAQNQDFHQHAHALLRYNLALWNRPFLFVDWRHDLWTTSEVPRPPQIRRQYKGSAQLSWIIPTRRGMSVLFTEYTYLDQTVFMNENSLWSLGLRFQH